jgi:hypothetical protein
MSSVRKIPQWKLDMLKDAEVAAALVVKADEAAQKAAEIAAIKAETAAQCKIWHASKPEWVMRMVEVTPGVRGGERGWEVEPKVSMRKVHNKELCPYCSKA